MSKCCICGTSSSFFDYYEWGNKVYCEMCMIDQLVKGTYLEKHETVEYVSPTEPNSKTKDPAVAIDRANFNYGLKILEVKEVEMKNNYQVALATIKADHEEMLEELKEIITWSASSRYYEYYSHKDKTYCEMCFIDYVFKLGVEAEENTKESEDK